jgi:hypothetical protein
MRTILLSAILSIVTVSTPVVAGHAQRRAAGAQAAAIRTVYLDRDGVIRWRDDRSEVSLYGANYVITTASDYRAAGYVNGDRRKMIDEDMAQFARMGWDGIRLTFWGDWESADSAGNLIANDHLDLLDYLTAKARERGIYMLFSPIQLYNAKWPDALADTTAPGFGRRYSRDIMGTDPAAIRAQVNYLRQILEHVNPYTGVAYKDEPAILFIELVNEPVHHPDDLDGSVRYINTLVDAVRSTGSRKLIFYNVSQDFRISPAIVRSKVDGITFGWYPTGLNSGFELEGNYLRGVDAFPDMLRPELARLPRIVYEFDSPDTREATMYPAMARTFRAVGTQFAAMFSYDMLGTASRNLGWQTHYLNLVYTPKKAMASIIAAEVMRRLPRMTNYGSYPANTRFGDFRISHAENLSELAARDAFLYAGSTSTPPPAPQLLRRIAGVGSSPVVRYDGTGIYFLDKVRPGVWRLEVYPDVVPVRDPFEPPSPDKIVTRAISRRRSMTVELPDLGAGFRVQPVGGGNVQVTAEDGRFTIEPGVYVLSKEALDLTSLPKQLGPIGFSEFHAPPSDTVPPTIESLSPAEVVAGKDAKLAALIVDDTPADSVLLFIRRTAGDWYHRYPMQPAEAYRYQATVPGDSLLPGPYEFVIVRFEGNTPITFPGGAAQQPWDWNYNQAGQRASGAEGQSVSWKLNVVSGASPVTLFSPGTDANRLAFTRIGDAGRRGLFSLDYSPITGQPVFRLRLPPGEGGSVLPDYTASLVIAGRIRAREESIASATNVRLRVRGLGPRQVLHLTLMEDDGTSWTRPITLDSAWTEISIPLQDFSVGKGVLLPQGFPGQWNYWVEAAGGRGGSGDRVRTEHIERLQLSLRSEPGATVGENYGVEIEWARLQ